MEGPRKCLLLLSLLAWLSAPNPNAVSAPLTFERDIRPILKAHCFHCHGEGDSIKGGVDLRLRRLMLTNAESGPVLVPNNPSASGLFKMVASAEMPKGEKKLTPTQIQVIQSWIQDGAQTLRPEPAQVPKFHITEEERQFWAFQTISNAPPPNVRNPAQIRSPIDHWIVGKLEAQSLSPAPPADRPTLIRRLSFDLTGLPPSPSEVAAFLADSSPRAYEKVVDRLLASPRYGERWARHWLDVVGYADSNGGTDTDSERPWSWRYRDYVVRSLNADLPFNEFIAEQLAGDEMLPDPKHPQNEDEVQKLVATGFLRMAPDPTGDGPNDPDLARNQVIADTVHIVSSSLLGMTVQCAQCHDHRYDPIPQSDYYRIRAVFEPGFDWKQWKSPSQRLVSLMPPQDRELADCIEHAAQVIDREAQALHDRLIEVFVQKQLLLVPESMREKVITARRTPADKRTEDHKLLLRDFPTFQDHIILGEIDQEGAKKVEQVRKGATDLRATKPEDPMVHAFVEEPDRKTETVLFHRGDHLQPKEKITPGGLSVLGAPPDSIPAFQTGKRTTGRRLAFAKSLTDGSHPLTPRVLVNRVWHHYFGTGLVATLGDFGVLGERPSHPELLDWLASSFVSNGWKLKSLHRLIVTSATYQQSSSNPEAQRADPDNRLLGRMRLRRLDAESLRDGMLQIGGRLNETMFGPPIPVAVSPQGQFVVGTQTKDGNGFPAGVGSVGNAEFRRSLFVQVRRTMPVGVMETFDAPPVTPNCEIRSSSTVPSQALMLMNDQFVLDRSNDLASRVQNEVPSSTEAQIISIWTRLFARRPSPPELSRAQDFLAQQTATLRTTFDKKNEASKQPSAKDKAPAATAPTDPARSALASLCQTLLGSNRFLYLD